MAAPIIKNYFHVTNGKQIFHNPELRQKQLNALEGKKGYDIIYEEYEATTTDQYGYYHAGIIDTCMQFEMFGGQSHDDIDELFSTMFLTYKTAVEINGKLYEKIKVEKKGQGFSKKKMKEFIEKCIQWCAEQGIVILTSEQYYLGKYKTTKK